MSSFSSNGNSPPELTRIFTLNDFVTGYEDEEPETDEEPTMSPPGLMRSNTICIPETDEETMSPPRLMRTDTVCIPETDEEPTMSLPRLVRSDTGIVDEESTLPRPRLMRTDTVYIPETNEEPPYWFLPPGLMRPDTIDVDDNEQQRASPQDSQPRQMMTNTVDVDDNEQRDFILPNGELWSWSAYYDARLQSGAVPVDDDEQQRDSLWSQQPFRMRSDAMVEVNNEISVSLMSPSPLMRTQSTTEQVDI